MQSGNSDDKIAAWADRIRKEPIRVYNRYRVAQLWIVAVFCLAVSWAVSEYWEGADMFALVIYLTGVAFSIAGFIYFLNRRLYVTKTPVEP